MLTENWNEWVYNPKQITPWQGSGETQFVPCGWSGSAVFFCEPIWTNVTKACYVVFLFLCIYLQEVTKTAVKGVYVGISLTAWNSNNAKQTHNQATCNNDWFIRHTLVSSLFVGSVYPDSIKDAKYLGEKIASVLNKYRLFFFAIICWNIQYNNDFYSFYIVLGIVSNLDTTESI